ncbi:glycerol kinase GlpK [Gehongia tenuis]|uniref:Glycerol kinase n=1 Tax=Gehongia tenuis TaxID=2763655 RepID=A0A926D2G2_9FIRM|nr:glycerol kinase GlpK [Gehongia tenuis]MBC8530259.1 glycerol kinase GlpK [Gehongia tenuis]
MGRVIVALDQGTTSSRAIAFDLKGRMVSGACEDATPSYPRPGWVEQNPEMLLESQLEALRGCLKRGNIDPGDVLAIGIANQRETTLLWDRQGRPLMNGVVWQCRRSAPICEKLREEGREAMIRERAGLIIDPYFSGTKIRWMLDALPDGQKRAERGEILFGTVDSWLIYHLTGRHATDVTNASRTMLFNIHTLDWDDELLAMLDIPKVMLPEVLPSSCPVGMMRPEFLGRAIPITGVAGDQHAALFGQCCFEAGSAKNTYGTGCFLLMNTGKEPVASQNNLITTVAWDLGGGAQYALEGSVFVAGAVVQWLRDEMGLIRTSADSEALAQSVQDTGGVYMVPAFTGLGAPHWDMYGRGTMVGITRGTTRAHIVRAALEAIAYQSADVLAACEKDSGIHLTGLKVDGGASANNFLMQFQADILNVPIERPKVWETTARGAAFLAGLAAGVYGGLDELRSLYETERIFEPAMAAADREHGLALWGRAVERAKGWAKEV